MIEGVHKGQKKFEKLLYLYDTTYFTSVFSSYNTKSSSQNCFQPKSSSQNCENVLCSLRTGQIKHIGRKTDIEIRHCTL